MDIGSLHWLAERRIGEAQRSGAFDHLPGIGKPLPADTLDPLTPAHLRVAMRILRNANTVPVEVLLRKELATIESEWHSIAACQREAVQPSQSPTGSTNPTAQPVKHPQSDHDALRQRRLELLIQLTRSRHSTL